MPGCSMLMMVPFVPASMSEMSSSPPMAARCPLLARELAGGLDLGQHGAGRELGGQGLQRVRVGASDGPLAGRAPVDVGGVGVGGHDEVVGVDAGRQQAGGVVLVDDRLDAHQLAVGAAVDGRTLVVGVHDRDAAAARADDHGALLQQPADLAQLEDAHGLGRRHHAAIVAAVRLERPLLLGRHGVRGGLVVDGPDGLAGILEGRVVDVDLDHGQHRGQGLVEGQQVAQLLLDEVADHALRLGTEDVQRVDRDLRVGGVLERQQTDLRPVAVGDDQLVLGGHRGQLAAGDADVLALVLAGHGFTPAEQGIAAEGDDDSHADVS